LDKKIPLHQEGGKGAILKGLGVRLAVELPFWLDSKGRFFQERNSVFSNNVVFFCVEKSIYNFSKMCCKVYAYFCKVFLSILYIPHPDFTP
jgi:hypothetical protein